MFIARNLLKFRQWNIVPPRHLSTGHPLNAGHSKWANIKHIKAQKDGQKAALFTRVSRQIRLAIQEGGSPDPALNSQLRSVIDNALRHNMPMSSIQNSIKKSQQSKSELKKYRIDIRYKQKVYAICTVYTDNFPGMKMDMTPMVKKAGGVFVDVSHMFEDFGLVEAKFDMSKLEAGQDLEERATEDAIECGAEEVEIVDGQNGDLHFICSPLHLNGLRRALESKGYLVESNEHVYTPNSLVELNAEEQKSYKVFLDKVRDIPGLEDIYDNVQANES